MEKNNNEIYIVNLAQAQAYIKAGLQPIRVEADNRLVFVFDRKATKPLFDKWCKHELEK